MLYFCVTGTTIGLFTPESLQTCDILLNHQVTETFQLQDNLMRSQSGAWYMSIFRTYLRGKKKVVMYERRKGILITISQPFLFQNTLKKTNICIKFWIIWDSAYSQRQAVKIKTLGTYLQIGLFGGFLNFGGNKMFNLKSHKDLKQQEKSSPK